MPDELRRAAHALGYTATGEHWIGAGRREYLQLQRESGAVRHLRAIKAALDPLGVLNPGRVL